MHPIYFEYGILLFFTILFLLIGYHVFYRFNARFISFLTIFGRGERVSEEAIKSSVLIKVVVRFLCVIILLLFYGIVETTASRIYDYQTGNFPTIEGKIEYVAIKTETKKAGISRTNRYREKDYNVAYFRLKEHPTTTFRSTDLKLINEGNLVKVTYHPKKTNNNYENVYFIELIE